MRKEIAKAKQEIIDGKNDLMYMTIQFWMSFISDIAIRLKQNN